MTSSIHRLQLTIHKPLTINYSQLKIENGKRLENGKQKTENEVTG